MHDFTQRNWSSKDPAQLFTREFKEETNAQGKVVSRSSHSLCSRLYDVNRIISRTKLYFSRILEVYTKDVVNQPKFPAGHSTTLQLLQLLSDGFQSLYQ